MNTVEKVPLNLTSIPLNSPVRRVMSAYNVQIILKSILSDNILLPLLALDSMIFNLPL